MFENGVYLIYALGPPRQGPRSTRRHTWPPPEECGASRGDGDPLKEILERLQRIGTALGSRSPAIRSGRALLGSLGEPT